MDERTFLKVKIKSLAAESRIIRKETKKASQKSIKDGLYLHRIWVVRTEARSTYLAYGFLRGREYNQIERIAHIEPDWKRVLQMVSKYCVHKPWYSLGGQAKKDKEVILERFDQWVKQGEQLQKEEAQKAQAGARQLGS